MGAPQISFFSYSMLTPLRSVSPHTTWGSPQISLFSYYMGVPLDQFLCLLYGDPLRSDSLHTIWGPLSDQLLRILNWGSLRSIFSHTIWGPLRSDSSLTVCVVLYCEVYTEGRLDRYRIGISILYIDVYVIKNHTKKIIL